MSAWQVVGFLGPASQRDIPTVLTAVIEDPTGANVVVSDIVLAEADLLTETPLPHAKFSARVAVGEATRLPKFPCKLEYVLFFHGECLEYIPVGEAEQKMLCFVAARREEGRQAIARSDYRTAYEAFELALRVSQEPEDIEQVKLLEQKLGIRPPFESYVRELAESPLKRSM